MIDTYLREILFRQRGDNRALADEIVEKLSPAARERLFGVLQDMSDDLSSAEQRAHNAWQANSHCDCL